MAKIKVRKGMPSAQLGKDEFKKRFLTNFYDPAFETVKRELDKVAEVAWDGYKEYRKSPRTVKAGKNFSDPDYDLSIEWLDTHKAVDAAERQQKSRKGSSRMLLGNGSSRSEHTCPGEMSKTWRLAKIAQHTIEKTRGFEVELLDLSLLTSEYGRKIYPCKACVSTAQPLCHWPCSCYPNHAIGQTSDWINEIYPKGVAAHGVMIITPVNWYQATSPLKLMIDRLVCGDGGNADPTTTHGKDAAKAKEIELKGWPYPRHLAGRAFSVVVHGDASGTENLRRILTDWMEDIGMIASGHLGHIDRFIGYLEPYATSHDDLDKDKDLQEDVRTAAQALVNAVKMLRKGELKPPDRGLHEARPK
ncbi:MAG: flavodoxin family protein [Pseudolabrys sp.]